MCAVVGRLAVLLITVCSASLSLTCQGVKAQRGWSVSISRLNIYAYTCMRTHMHTYICTCAWAHIHTHTYIRTYCMHGHTHSHTHAHIRTQVCVLARVHLLNGLVAALVYTSGFAKLCVISDIVTTNWALGGVSVPGPGWRSGLAAAPRHLTPGPGASWVCWLMERTDSTARNETETCKGGLRVCLCLYTGSVLVWGGGIKRGCWRGVIGADVPHCLRLDPGRQSQL